MTPEQHKQVHFHGSDMNGGCRVPETAGGTPRDLCLSLVDTLTMTHQMSPLFPSPGPQATQLIVHFADFDVVAAGSVLQSL